MKFVVELINADKFVCDSMEEAVSLAHDKDDIAFIDIEYEDGAEISIEYEKGKPVKFMYFGENHTLKIIKSFDKWIISNRNETRAISLDSLIFLLGFVDNRLVEVVKNEVMKRGEKS
mgnify:CR=1 FL=1